MDDVKFEFPPLAGQVNTEKHCPTCTCVAVVTLLLTPNADGTQTGRLRRIPPQGGMMPIADMETLNIGIYDAGGTLLRILPREEWPAGE